MTNSVCSRHAAHQAVAVTGTYAAVALSPAGSRLLTGAGLPAGAGLLARA